MNSRDTHACVFVCVYMCMRVCAHVYVPRDFASRTLTARTCHPNDAAKNGRKVANHSAANANKQQCYSKARDPSVDVRRWNQRGNHFPADTEQFKIQ